MTGKKPIIGYTIAIIIALALVYWSDQSSGKRDARTEEMYKILDEVGFSSEVKLRDCVYIENAVHSLGCDIEATDEDARPQLDILVVKLKKSGWRLAERAERPIFCRRPSAIELYPDDDGTRLRRIVVMKVAAPESAGELPEAEKACLTVATR